MTLMHGTTSQRRLHSSHSPCCQYFARPDREDSTHHSTRLSRFGTCSTSATCLATVRTDAAPMLPSQYLVLSIYRPESRILTPFTPCQIHATAGRGPVI